MANIFRFVKDSFGHLNGISFIEQTEQAINDVSKIPQELIDVADIKVEQLSEAVSQAQASAVSASNSATTAGTSAGNAAIWAEGSDAQVSALGGTHSAKGWFSELNPSMTYITTVANNIDTVTAVANNSTNINAVNSNATNINAVNANKTNIDTVAGANTNIGTIVTNLTDIQTVATGIDDIEDVADNLTTISAVNSNASNINAVNANAANINSVSSNATAINTVATNISTVTSVSSCIADIEAVSEISSDVTAVAAIDDDVSAVALVAEDVSTVADATTNVSTVATNIANVNSVGGSISNVNAVAGDLTNINAVAADLTNIDAASGYATQAKQYAIGEPTEPTGGHSSKWYSEHMALVPKGTYSASVSYAKNEWVRNQVASTTSCYVSLVDDNVGNSLTDTSKWMFMFSVVSGATVSWGNIEGLLANQTDLQTALDAKATTSALTTHTSDTSNPHSVTKAQVGLGNVDNTSDLSKPISTATQSALDEKADASTTLEGYGITDAHITDGVITLGEDTITPLTQHQSLSGYATESWVEGKGYLTSASLSGYATESWVEGKGYLDSSSTLDATKLSGTASINTTGNAATATTATSATSATTATNYSETGGIATALSGKQATISDLADIRSGAALGATAQQPATTLSGYGITDANITGGVITLGSNTITPLTAHQDISGKANLSGATFSGAIIDQQGYPVYGVPNTPEAHNCLYRGKEHTVEGLSAKVLANDFSDIFIGDYFKVSFSTAYGTVSNQKVLVAGINYFKNCGDSATPTPHLVMIPETSFGSAAMNATNTTEGAYAGSAMHTTVLPAIATALKTAIGSSHVVAQSRLLTTRMTATTPSMAGAGYNGASTDLAWTDCDLCLMSEPMVYGTTVLSSSFFDVGDRKQQLPIFALNPQIANTRSTWWLSSVANAYSFALVAWYGDAGRTGASSVSVVRPLLVFR